MYLYVYMQVYIQSSKQMYIDSMCMYVFTTNIYASVCM